jgi:hypothetical protein
MCIIPPLSCSKKLPIDTIVEFIRQCMREHEMLGHWERVVPVYIRLFQECKPLTPPIFRKVTAVLLHHFWSVSYTLKRREKQKRTDSVEELRKKKEEILIEFGMLEDTNSLSALIQNFRELYRKGHNFDLPEDSVPLMPLATKDSGDVHGFFNHPKVFSRIRALRLLDVMKDIVSDVLMKEIFLARLHFIMQQ